MHGRKRVRKRSGWFSAVAATRRLIEQEHQKSKRLHEMGESCMQTLTEMRKHVDGLQAQLVEEANVEREVEARDTPDPDSNKEH